MDDPERLLVAIWRPKRTTRFRPIPVVPPTKSDAVAAQRCARLAYRSVRSRLSIQPEANELPVLDDRPAADLRHLPVRHFGAVGGESGSETGQVF